MAGEEGTIVPVSVETPEWSNEALLLAALVVRAGGNLSVTQREVSGVTGLSFHVDPVSKDVQISAQGDPR